MVDCQIKSILNRVIDSKWTDWADVATVVEYNFQLKTY